MPEAQVFDLKQYRNTSGSAASQREVRLEAQVETNVDALRSPRETKLEELYAAETSSSALIRRARELLEDASERAEQARSLLANNDIIGSDQQIMLLQANLPELFCCRELSQGLSALVLALHYSLYNCRGAPLTLDQIFVVKRSLDHLRNNIFIAFEQSLDLIDCLEDSGLLTEPLETAALSDVITEPAAT